MVIAIISIYCCLVAAIILYITFHREFDEEKHMAARRIAPAVPPPSRHFWHWRWHHR